MKIDVYRNQTEIEKTFEVDSYDLMYGTVEDIFQLLDGLDEKSSDADFFKALNANRGKINGLILDVFPEMTEEDLRGIKVKDLIPFFVELFGFVFEMFGDQPKN